MDTLTIYENELNTSPFRQRTLSKHHSKLRNACVSLERKVFLDSLMVVLTVVEAIQFPLEIPNPNASSFLDSSSQRCKTLPISISPTIKGQSL